jgi:hypothetical protein
VLSEDTIRRQRRTLEADARGAARNGDYETWLRAIGGTVALDMVLGEDWPHAAERIPFKATQAVRVSRRTATQRAASARDVGELFERGRLILLKAA